MPQNSTQIKYACLHTHTRFCDGKGEPWDYCQSAWEKGFDSIGFSTHAPITKKTGLKDPCWQNREQRLDQYIEAVNAAKKEWEGRLKVFLGLEVDYLEGFMGPADSDYHNLGLDYIIGSVHFVTPKNGAPFCVDHRMEVFGKNVQESYGGDIDAVINAYYGSLQSMMKAGGFDILGHPDLIKKNNFLNRFFDEDTSFYRKKCESTATAAAQCGIVIEVNTGAMIRGYLDSPYPSLPLLQLFRKNNVPAMINADAHYPGHLGGFYEEGKNTLLAAGYNKMVLFEGRKNGVAVWKDEEI
ncbi:MAG: histidinol-phosphatase [Treponema sp.]|nr:histidinol-phosphatase [Treponema sp.]